MRVLSLPLGFLAAHNVSPRPVSAAVRVFLDAIRAFPEIVLAVVVFVPIAGLGPFAGALAIGIHSVGTLGKLTAEAIESIDRGPVEAARATGGSALQVQRWAVVPQVLPEIIAFWLYRFEVNVRAAAVLGVVGAGGIGSLLSGDPDATAATTRRARSSSSSSWPPWSSTRSRVDSVGASSRARAAAAPPPSRRSSTRRSSSSRRAPRPTALSAS